MVWAGGLLGRLGRELDALAAVVDGRVGGEFLEPGVEGAFGIVSAQVAIELDEDLLGQVMGLVGVSQMLVGETVNAALQAANQLLEGLAVASRRLADELGGGERGGWPGVAHGSSRRFLRRGMHHTLVTHPWNSGLRRALARGRATGPRRGPGGAPAGPSLPLSAPPPADAPGAQRSLDSKGATTQPVNF